MSYENYMECLKSYEEVDPTGVYLERAFNFTGTRGILHGAEEEDTTYIAHYLSQVKYDLELYSKVEEVFQCSGMCKSSLFYFSQDMSTHAYPKETCLHRIKTFIHDNGKPYADSCIATSVYSFFLFLFHFVLYHYKEDIDDDDDKRDSVV